MSDIEKRVADLEEAVTELRQWKSEQAAAASAAMERFRAIMTDAAVDEACLLAGLDPVAR